jgi:hypothetical protein
MLSISEAHGSRAGSTAEFSSSSSSSSSKQISLTETSLKQQDKVAVCLADYQCLLQLPQV